MAKIQLNESQRIVAYHLAVLWGQVKKAGGSHSRRLMRIVERLRIEELEEEDRAEAQKPEAERKRRWHSDRAEGFELDEDGSRPLGARVNPERVFNGFHAHRFPWVPGDQI